MAAKVLLRLGVNARARGRTELAVEDGLGVRALHAIHRVVDHREVLALEELLDGAKVEDLFEQRHVILDAGEDDDFEAVGELVLGRRVERDVRQAAADLVLGDRRRVLIDLVGELLGRGAAILAVVLDSKVLVNTTRVVGRGQDEAADRCCAAGRVTRADHRRHGRGREQTACAAPDARDACGRGHLDDDLDGRRVEVPTVAGDAECAALDGHTLRHEGVEDGLHEVLQVALAHEGARLLAQARGARLLAGDRLRNNGRHLHGYLGEEVFAWQQTGGSGRGACERVAHASARIKCGRHPQDGCGELRIKAAGDGHR